MAVYAREFTRGTHCIISTVHTDWWIDSSVAGTKRIAIWHSRAVGNITACSLPPVKAITLLCNKQTYTMTSAVNTFSWTTHCFTLRSSPSTITDTLALFTLAVAITFRATVYSNVAAVAAASIPRC